jgi:hypothetical protein
MARLLPHFETRMAFSLIYIPRCISLYRQGQEVLPSR